MEQRTGLQVALEDIRRRKTRRKPRVGVVLGSGLGDFAEELEEKETLSYAEIEGFPVSTAPNHEGRFVFGLLDEIPVVCMQGRVHLYEGYSPEEVVLPVRLLSALGVKILVLTNAAGSVNPEFRPGDFMAIRDHISSFVPSPLIGPNDDDIGLRFPDMSHVYDEGFIEAFRSAARELDVKLQEGVYIQFTGPNFETPAEVRMARLLGADAVGMSTAIEAMAARHAGMRVYGISLITNDGAGLSDTPLSQEEVVETAERVASEFRLLLRCGIKKIVAEEKKMG